MPQKYRCLGCGDTRWLPERPTTAPLTVRVGCDGFCDGITTHEKPGAVPRDRGRY